MDRDDQLASLVNLLEGRADSLGPDAQDALAKLREAADERTVKLTEMMTELSFQDLTCQAIQKISGTIVNVERRLHELLDPMEDEELGTGQKGPAHFSGLSRLEEAGAGQSRQGDIDDLLNRR
ncbi:MAG: protein phosphatase CheZ [Myxococcales bacterium]|nr:protein phosphatase CheZ [Myxococcales bacterium]